jgi:hypothetical protein
MGQPLKKFKEEFSSILLHWLWQRWCALGVFGNVEPVKGQIIDPEALILLTSSIGRCDPRLFDEMMDWLSINWELVNVSRLNFMLRRYSWQGNNALGALANWMIQDKGKKTKWFSLVGKGNQHKELVPFFLDRNGKTMPVFGKPDPAFAEQGFFRGTVTLRKKTQPFIPENSSSLLLSLRSFFGTNVRAEIVAYLLTHPGGGHPSGIARETGYYQKTVHQALVSMSKSKLVECRNTGREKIYRIDPRLSDSFLCNIKAKPIWIQFPPICSLFEGIWSKIHEQGFMELSQAMQSIELRDIANPLTKEISHPAFTKLFSNRAQGENFTSELILAINNFLKEQ